jgi:hypothetical protein
VPTGIIKDIEQQHFGYRGKGLGILYAEPGAVGKLPVLRAYLISDMHTYEIAGRRAKEVLERASIRMSAKRNLCSN